MLIYNNSQTNLKIRESIKIYTEIRDNILGIINIAISTVFQVHVFQGQGITVFKITGMRDDQTQNKH